jgi:hypothetical protein
MQISIWQQWASNHSALYTVVGDFATIEAANRAGEVIGRFLAEMTEWIVEGDPAEYQRAQENARISSVELRYAATYGVEWVTGIDWLHYYPWNRLDYRDIPLDHLLLYERLVGINAPGVYTWQNGHQFSRLITALGGTAYHDAHWADKPEGGEDYCTLRFELMGTAPDEQAVHAIQTAINAHTGEPGDPLPPWAAYHPQYAKIMRLHSRPRFPELVQQYQQFITDRTPLPEFFQRALHNLEKETRIYHPRSEADGCRIRLRADGSSNAAAALPALLAWLKSQGCSDITYRLEEQEG